MKQENQIEECRGRWFKNHKATFKTFSCAGFKDMEVLYWKDPDSWNYSTTYIIDRSTLTVHGDIGEAVYRWRQEITWEFLAGCDLDYFVGKCQASETGRQFQIWDEDECLAAAKQYLKDTGVSKDHEEILDYAKDYMYFQNEWAQFVYNDTDYGKYFLDDDCSLMSVGWDVHPRAVGHWLGIKMAIEQLKK